MVMKVYSPEFKADAVALYLSDPSHTFEGIGKDPWGKQRAGFSAKTEIDRRQWGLEWNQSLETGGVLVGHTVKIEADVQAVKQEAGQAVA